VVLSASGSPFIESERCSLFVQRFEPVLASIAWSAPSNVFMKRRSEIEVGTVFEGISSDDIFEIIELERRTKC